jgi:hypothetical protein
MSGFQGIDVQTLIIAQAARIHLQRASNKV